jgi:hypothetical protein
MSDKLFFVSDIALRSSLVTTTTYSFGSGILLKSIGSAYSPVDPFNQRRRKREQEPIFQLIVKSASRPYIGV